MKNEDQVNETAFLDQNTNMVTLMTTLQNHGISPHFFCAWHCLGHRAAGLRP
jgi:hypothetical protein